VRIVGKDLSRHPQTLSLVGKPTGGQNLRKPWAIRRDQNAVSPVIATILMVAITVVLAAVLYVMVSGLVTGPGQTPQSIGYSVSKTQDGANWIIELIDVPAGMKNSTVSLTIFNTDGTISVQKTALSSLLTTTSGVRYVPITSGDTLEPGDRILVSTTTYAAGSSFELVNADSVLASGTLQ
jgi:flagellin-like protein